MIARDQSTHAQDGRLSSSVEQSMLAMVPRLRAFAVSLCGNADRADDLVQETLLRAITHIDSFEPGSNLGAWLATILRNCFLSEARKRCKEVEDAKGSYVQSLLSAPEQESRLGMEEFRAALAKLPFDQREALLLVGAAGFSYEDIAAICQTTTGTIKSRINRARTRLAMLLSIESINDLGCDDQTRAILDSNNGGCWAQCR
jgi:RNA polymerase sigma-70 factor (ECF subfamily)